MDSILFFDGECVMCNGLVDFVLRHNKLQHIKFATLQGQTAERLIPELRASLNTVVLLDEEGLYTKSDAIIKLFMKLGGFFRLAMLLKICPKVVRDQVYQWIARNRYRFFGQRQCRLPSANERSRILD